MPSALELSIKHGIPIAKIRSLADDGLQFTDSDAVPDAQMLRAARDIRYRRVSPFAIAYALRQLKIASPESFQRYETLAGYAAADYGTELGKGEESIGDPWGDLLPGADVEIDKVLAGKAGASERLAAWCKACLDQSSGELPYDWLAVRLLLSVPEAKMLDYPKPIASAVNRLKHQGLLDGYWHNAVDAHGKAKTIFHNPLDL
jgi:hypothetical protein